jgi:hypothetical protein
MQYEISIPLRYLLAARVFTPKNDTRPQLNGVAIDEEYVFGTDGTVLGAIRLHLVDPTVPGVIIPNDAIDYFAKKAKASSLKDVTIQWGEDQGVLTNGVATENFKPVEGKPVPFKRVIPGNSKPEGHIQFQAELLLKFEKAATLLGAKKGFNHAFVLPNGDGQPARVVLPGYPEFTGVLCPLRHERVEKELNELMMEDLV